MDDSKPDYSSMLLPLPEAMSRPEAEIVQLHSTRPPRLPRTAGLFSPLPLAWLVDRKWDVVMPPVPRLYHYLRIKSRRSLYPVTLTAEMAAEIGLSRLQRWRALRVLEQAGVVEVVRRDALGPVVTVKAQPG
jgi:hypothetical protein